ncbi:DUF3105 domain-containing protein [Nocardioides pacificus]
MVKPAKNDRRAVVDKMRAQQKRADRRRGVAIVGVCVGIALLIVVAAAYKPLKDQWDRKKFEDQEIDAIGAPASACDDVITKPADGNQDHVPVGTELTFEDSPPAFGQHWDQWDSMDRKLYTQEDRPELGMMIHNLEHGFTILWYDETAADDEQMMDDITGLATKFKGTENFRNKFKAVPWMEKDGEPFPEGKHIALTHWSIGGEGEAVDAGKQVGVWQYCSEPSGEALEQFMLDYPYLDSPEPDAA